MLTPDDSLPADAIARLGSLHFRPGHRVRALGFSPDGRFLLSSGFTASDGAATTTEIWDAATGVLIRAIDHSAPGFAISPDGAVLAVGSKDSVRLLRFPSGEEMRGPMNAFGRVVGFVRGGDAIAVENRYSNDFEVVIVDLRRGPGATLHGYGREFLALSPDGRTAAIRMELGAGPLLVVGFSSLSALFPPTMPGYGRQDYKVHWESSMESPQGAAFSPDGSRLAIAGFPTPDAPPVVEIWDVHAGTQISTFPGNLPLAFAPNAPLLAFGTIGDSNPIEGINYWTGLGLRDLATGGERWRVEMPFPDVCAFNPTGETLAVAADGNPRIGLYDVATGKGRPPVAEEIAGYPRFAPDGSLWVWLGSTDSRSRTPRMLWRFDPRTGRPLGRVDVRGDFTFAPDGSLVWVFAHELLFVDPSTGAERRRVAKTGWGASPLFLDQGRLVAAGGGLYEVATGRKLLEFKTYDAPRGEYFPESFAACGRWLFVIYGSYEHGGCVLAFDLATLEGPIETTLPPAGFFLAPDGQRVIVEGGTATVYDFERLVASRRPVTQRRYPSPSLNEACREEFAVPAPLATLPPSTNQWATTQSPDGRRLARWVDGRISLCDASTGGEIRTLSGHRGRGGGLDFSPDGDLLASSAEDGTVLVWNVEP